MLPLFNGASQVVKWARWGTANSKHFTYSEGSDRMTAIGTPAGTLPITCDCSAFVTLCFFWAGLPDPNGLRYNHEGYTGTLLSHGKRVALKNVRAGDVVVYGTGTGVHTAIVVEASLTGRILTVSMGQNGDPSYVWTTGPTQPFDGRTPQTFLRFPMNPVHAALRKVAKAVLTRHPPLEAPRPAAV